MNMKEFNTFGPSYLEEHYHINRHEVKAQIYAKIEQGGYFTLNAARQLGWTT